MTYHGGYEKAAPFYDIFDNKQNIDFFYHYAKEHGKILDIGAGTGRIAIPIAKKGIKVYCVEPSPAMVAQFRMKLEQKPELKKNIVLINNEAAEFKFEKTFPAAFMSGTFDHFLTDKERIDALNNIKDHLDNKGILVFDVYLGLMKDSDIHPAGKAVQGNREYRRFIKNDVKSNNLLEVSLIYEIYQNGQLVSRIEEKSQAGIISRIHIRELLEITGYTIEKEYSDFDFSPYSRGSELLILEAVKKE